MDINFINSDFCIHVLNEISHEETKIIMSHRNNVSAVNNYVRAFLNNCYRYKRTQICINIHFQFSRVKCAVSGSEVVALGDVKLIIILTGVV